MKNKFYIISLVTLAFSTSCNNEQEKFAALRGHSPWVFRSVLDNMPRMVTLALSKDVWAAYRTDSCAIYKVWKGSVNLDGAVYTTVHGPQPSAIGDAFFVNQHQQPWVLVQNGQNVVPSVQYRGHRFDKNGHVELQYELKTPQGKIIQIKERPELILGHNDEMDGFERRFSTSDVPEGTTVTLLTNISSVHSNAQVTTTGGTFKSESTTPRNTVGLQSVDLQGKLTLKSNGVTHFAAIFTKEPTVISENKVVGRTSDLERPVGAQLIDRNDCKSCHNEQVKTVGPSYAEIAQRYPNNEVTVKMLTSKVQKGGAGVWGQAAMTAHPTLKEEDIRQMVEYVLSLDSKTEGQQKGGKGDALAPSLANAKESLKGINDNDYFAGALVKIYQYQKDLNKMADADNEAKKEPVYAGIAPAIHIEPQDFKNLEANFSMTVTGYLKIPKTNNYTFRVYSDDGSILWIDESEVINHDGLHGGDPKDGELSLKEGLHPFKLRYFQGRGGKGVSLQWRSFDDGEFTVIRAPDLLHRKDEQTQVAGKTLPMANIKRIPGDAFALQGVHPSYDLTQARPADFAPKVGGMDFLPDGRLVISTWDEVGGVYILDNVEKGNPNQIRVKQIATGLAEPLGLKVVDGRIYVLQKQELTELIDRNGDEIIDEYRTLSNQWKVSSNFHEFAFGLAYKDGFFYGALATAILPGGASAKPQIPDRGKIFKISKKDGAMEFVAQGLRTPNTVGIGIDNEIFVNDNQGDWLPSCKLLHVKQGAFFGSYSVDSAGTAKLPIQQPVVWLPQDEIGNSASQMTFINDGLYKGQMIHGEVTNGGLKRVFVEKVNGDYQGCAFHFSQGFEAGINRLVWGPDGALYVGGIGSTGNWGHDGDKWFGLQRFKYNGKPAFEPLAIRAKTNGFELELTEPLREGDGWNANDYEIKRWWYKPTKDYGGPKMEETELKPLSINVSADRKKVFFELDAKDLKERHVFYVHIKTPFISQYGNELWITEGYYTMNNLPQNLAGVKTVPPPTAIANTLTPAEQKAGWKLLFDGKTISGWRNFNKKTIGKSWTIDATEQALHLKAAQKPDGGWQSTDGGDIITEKEYQNYELNLEWKIAPCGNSGIIYNVIENGKMVPAKTAQEKDTMVHQLQYVWQSGPEMQVLDNTCHPDAKIEKHRAGDLYDMIACKYVTVNPQGDWNQARLIIKNGQVEHWLNGRKVVSFKIHDQSWKSMIAKSKFKSMPFFGMGRKGHIALQDHGDKVWYRNIKIREF
jgi:cytochrome c